MVGASAGGCGVRVHAHGMRALSPEDSVAPPPPSPHERQRPAERGLDWAYPGRNIAARLGRSASRPQRVQAAARRVRCRDVSGGPAER